MATVAITTTPVAVTIPANEPVTASAACTLGLTSAGAASGPTVNGNFNWPSLGNAAAYVTLWVQTATTANLNYLS